MAFKFNLASIITAMVQAISNAVNALAPDTIDPADKANLQKYVGSAYALAKNFGPGLVASSANDLDDAILNELIEVCELAADKYSLVLDPTTL